MKKFQNLLCVLSLLIAISAIGTAYANYTQIRRAAITSSIIDNTTVGQTTPLAGTFTQLMATLGITSDGGGIKHKRFTSCTTPATTAAFCQSTLAWTTPFRDANYTLTCSTQSGTLFMAAINNKTAAGANPIVELTPGNTAAASTEIDCVGIHD